MPRPPRSAQSDLGSADTYLELARYAHKYDHSGMAFQRCRVSMSDVAFFMEQIAHRDVASRAIGSILLGHIAATKMQHEKLFGEIIPTVRKLNDAVPMLATEEVSPVIATVESLANIEDVAPFSQNNHRPIERVVEVVHRSLITLLDRREEGMLDDAQVSRVFTMMGVELIPFAVKSHAEALGRLTRAGDIDEKGRRVVDEVVNGGIDALRGVQEFGLTPETRGVAMNSLKSLMKSWEPLSQMVPGAHTFLATR